MSDTLSQTKCEWKETTLGEVINLRRGHDLPKQKRVKGVIPIISSSGITGYHNEHKAVGPGVVTGRYGTIGQVFYVKGQYWPLNTTLYVDDFKGNVPLFVSYFLRSIDFDKYNDKSTVPGINRNHIHLEEVSIPPIEEQTAIASILSSLDDKIDLLHRQNQTLEQLAETLFREWFVETEGESMDLTDFIQINPKESLKKGVPAPYLEMRNLDTKSANPNYWYDREFTSGTKFRNGDTVMARITPCIENGKKAYIQFMENGQLGWGSTEFLVFRTFADFHPFSSYLLAMNDDFKAFAEKTMTGSSGRQRVQTDSLKKYTLNRPTPCKLKELNHSFEVYSKKLKLNQTQIRTLTALRDTLLPKLMSGEVRVK